MQTFWDWLHAYGARWHDVWEIVGALGALAAVVATVALGWADRKHREDEMKRLETERDDAKAEAKEATERDAYRARSEQARQVGVWVEASIDMGRPDPLTGIPEVGRLWDALKVVNYSPFPIFDVDFVYFYDTDEALRPPTMRSRLDQSQQHVHRDEPGIDEARSYVHFRDLAGTSWCRYVDGRLVEGPAPHDLTRVIHRP